MEIAGEKGKLHCLVYSASHIKARRKITDG